MTSMLWSTPVVALLLALFSSVSLIEGSAWNRNNDPELFSSFGTLNFNFKQLPQKAQTNVTPWSDTYWPSYESGIAHRWQSDKPNDFNYQLNTKEQLHSMSVSKLKVLSPAEKYDIFVQRYDYPTVKSEWQRTSPNDESWEGLCHGWAPAAIQFKQPNPVTLTNPDGIQLQFATSDITALLTYYTAEYADQQTPTAFAGGRCKYDLTANPDKENTTECADLNAGSSHILMTNMIGLLNQPYVIDRDRSIQVWNQPLFAYTSTVLGSRPPSQGSAPGTKQEVHVSTEVKEIVELYPHPNAVSPATRVEKWEYWVELDAQNNILGGSYVSWKRPDFVWGLEQVVQPAGFFKQLSTIYKASTNSSLVPSPSMAVMASAKRTNVAPPRTTVLSQTTGSFASPVGSDGVTYPDNLNVRWTIAPAGDIASIEITFAEGFCTEKTVDKVKIYEGVNGDGALVAVLHGTKANAHSITVNAPAVVVTFRSDESQGCSGFRASYKALSRN